MCVHRKKLSGRICAAALGRRDFMARSSKSRVLTDREEIRNWAEERQARPSCVRGTGGDNDIGMIRLDFPGYTGENSLEEISWDDWFNKFEERNLALLVQDETAGGQKSNFNKLVSRETAKAAEEVGRSRQGRGRARVRAGGVRSRRTRSQSRGARRSSWRSRSASRRASGTSSRRTRRSSESGSSRRTRSSGSSRSRRSSTRSSGSSRSGRASNRTSRSSTSRRRSRRKASSRRSSGRSPSVRSGGSRSRARRGSRSTSSGRKSSRGTSSARRQRGSEVEMVCIEKPVRGGRKRAA